MEEQKGKPVRRIILVAPLEHRIEFRVEPDDAKFPGMMIMGAYIGNKMICRKASAAPPPEIEKQIRLKGKSFIPDIRPLVYTGVEEDLGGDLKALLAIPSRPVKYEDLPDGGMDPKLLEPLTAIGMNIRPVEKRTHLKDLMKECCAHLDDILDNVDPPQKIEEVPKILQLKPLARVPHGPLMCVHNVAWRTCPTCRS